MAVAALIDLGADVKKLEMALQSLGLGDEFTYEITDVTVNSIHAKNFNVILPKQRMEQGSLIDNNSQHQNCRDEHHHKHHHEHRNLDDVNKILDKAEITDSARVLAKKIFRIVAEAEAKVHDKTLDMVHFHEVGAIDSIVDILSFSVLYDDLNPKNSYISTLSEGKGFVECAHGTLLVPVPAVCEILSKYDLQIKITENEGEMVTPTGAAIASAIGVSANSTTDLKEGFKIKKIGYGAGKRKYKNPALRIMAIEF